MTKSEAPDLYTVRSAHLVGIGGTAMTPLATILLQMGKVITGSDVTPNPAMQPLRDLGAQIHIGHQAENVGDVDVVIASSAVPGTNPEIAAAQAHGIPVIKHSAALGSLMRKRRGVAIAGTHGKTTTSALTSYVLDRGGLDPTFHVGSELLNYGVFGRQGSGDILVAEADEYDRRFLDYDPEIAIITSIEPDHLDYFGDFDQVVAAFQTFVRQIRPGGFLVVSADDGIALGLQAEGIERVTYGLAPDADWRVTDWKADGASQSKIGIIGPDGVANTFTLGLLGRHNAQNAAAVAAVAHRLGIPWDRVSEGFAEFRGTRRRFEVIGEADSVIVADDYAHHPTAIRVTLAAARAHFTGPIWAIFQPHTAHRTLSLFDEFSHAFTDADHVIIAPTYRPAGREVDENDPTIRALVDAMRHPDATTLEPEAVIERVTHEAQPGDLVLIMGAGDLWTIEQELLARLRRRSQHEGSKRG